MACIRGGIGAILGMWLVKLLDHTAGKIRLTSNQRKSVVEQIEMSLMILYIAEPDTISCRLSGSIASIHDILCASVSISRVKT